MRKLALLTLFAAAALLTGVADSAFAHPNHHVQQTQSAPAANFEIAASEIEYAAYSEGVVSAVQPQQDHRPHGQGMGCEFCCACAGSTSVALATPEFVGGGLRVHNQVSALTTAYEIRHAVFDLSRPPKSFA